MRETVKRQFCRNCAHVDVRRVLNPETRVIETIEARHGENEPNIYRFRVELQGDIFTVKCETCQGVLFQVDKKYVEGFEYG